MAFKFELITPDGDNVGSFESAEQNWQPGDTLIGHGNRRFRVPAVLPVEPMSEFVDEPGYGVLEVQPL